jgi:ABC-2 type transport system permease protein
MNVYALEARYEFLKLWRMPGFSVPSLLFPVMFYSLFGIAWGGGRMTGGTTMATYLVATYGAFGVIGAALFGFGVGVAVERGQGWMTLKRATPMPPLAYFVAKLAMAAIFGAMIIMLLAAMGILFGGVRLSGVAWAQLVVTLILGAIPFAAIGLALGYFAGPNSAPPIVNIVYLPLSFLSGLWIPIEVLPPVFKSIAQILPPYHFGQLALNAVGASAGAPAWTHILALCGFTIMGLGVALWGYRRDEETHW